MFRFPLSSRRAARGFAICGGGALLVAGAAIVLLGVWSGSLPLLASAPARADDERPARTNPAAPGDAAQEKREFAARVRPFLEKYCLDCHGEVLQEEGISFHRFDGATSAKAAHTLWTKAADRLRFDSMPPEDHGSRPTAEERDAVLKWLDERVFAVDCSQTDDPGRETIRRLNRIEYDNTIRDLVGVRIQPGRDFPSDDVGEGFDNIGDVLSLSPLLFEKYLDAAEKIADAAIGARIFEPFVYRYHAEDLDLSNGVRRQGSFVAMSSVGEAYTTIELPTDGDYVFRAEAEADQAGPEKAKMNFLVDGNPIDTITVTNGREEGKVYEAKFTSTRGRHRIAAAFINDYYKPDAKDRRDRDRNLYVRWIEIERTSVPAWDSLPESHRRIVFVRPDEKEKISLADAATQVVRRFATRAFRRPATNAEVARYARLVETAVGRGRSFEEGVQLAVQAILVSPHFLFRVERDAQPEDPRAVRTLTDYELASRLSYFLWSSMPDEELFELAAKGQLRIPKVLDAQVRRMLQDDKASALAENFGGQWLNLRRLDELSPDPEFAGPFGTQLREDMRRETLLFFETVIREDRPISDFLHAKYTFLNDRLAKHYGIEGVRGKEFRKVSLEGEPRSGVLTHASVLSLTSNPQRTSPVKRGKWILENMLASAPPDPPANVPDLDETRKAHDGASLREQLEIHRENPTCASCHVTMDAIGFGFENFDILGRWRTKDGAHPVDSSGELPSGETFAGPIELVEILGKRQTDFSRCLTEKMLVYALGRGLRPYDECAVNEIVARIERDGGRFSSVVLGIVHSEPFQKRRGDGGQP